METLAFLVQTAIVTRALFLMPFEGRRKYERLRQSLRNDPRARVFFYVRFIVSWWVIAALVLVSVWLGSDTLAQLRLTAPSRIAVPIAIVWVLFTAWPVIRSRRQGPYQDAVRAALGRVPELLPTKRAEQLLFAAVSITAGVCEELVFRGLVPLYVAKLFPGSGPLGAVVSVVGFGVAHAYQGARGILLTTLLGALLMTVTLLTGSIDLAMAFHALNDLRVLVLASLARPPAGRQA